MKDRFLEIMPNPVIVYNSEWKIIKINQPALQFLGYSSPDELLGESIQTLLPAGKTDLVDELNSLLQRAHKIHPGKEIQHVRKDGALVKLFAQFKISGVEKDPLKFNFVESGIIMGDGMEGHDQRLKELKCWKVLAENVPSLIMMLVDKNLHVHCSIGRGKNVVSDFEAESLVERLPGGLVKVLKPLLEIAFEGTSVSRELMHGREHYAARLTPLKHPEEGPLCVIVLQNITETKLAERRLKISKKEAEEANEAKSNFIAKMSHEIRTPLNAIIGFSEQLSKTRLTKKQTSFIEVVNNSSHHLLSTIDDILVLTKIESGQVEATEEPFRLADVLKAVNDVLELRYKSKNLDFQIQCDPDQQEVLLGDPAKLRQVLINLVNNAIKFTKKGGITLICSTQENNPERISLRFMVKDTGIGIAPDELESIFKPFHQADNSISRRYFGSGLGLTISKDLVESMGGNILVQSTLGKGSTFSFALTFKKTTKQLPERDYSCSFLPEAPVNHLRVLFVDDDPVNSLLVKVIFDQYKVKSVFASSGEEALNRFSSGDYNVILLDINMPGMSGIDVAQRIRKMENKYGLKSRTRIIAMTANILRKHIEEYYKAGMDDVLLKPFKEEHLLGKLVNHTFERMGERSDMAHSSRLEKTDPDDNLNELLKITKGNKEFTLLMLDAFIDNGKTMKKKIKASLKARDYRGIAESAHRLLASVEQLGFRKTADLLRLIERRYMKKKNIEEDPQLIKHAIREIDACIASIEKARIEFL
ncbi:MAG: ATP-binding protein [Bacteroides sp.]|jgi:PAS domain S-box-containing protein|nr:ATP-binding protein [Bacteroides sp.]